MFNGLHEARKQVAIALKHQTDSRLNGLDFFVLVLLVAVELLSVWRVGMQVVALHVVKIKSRNEEAISFGEANCFFDCLSKMRKLFRIRHVKIDRRYIDLILVRKLLELGFVVWSSLQLFSSIHFLVVDHRNQYDVHAAVDRAEYLLLLLIMRLVDVVRPLVEVDCLQLSNVVVEAGKDNVWHNFVCDACLTNIFDSYGPGNLLILEGFSELFIGHPVFLGFAEAILLLQSLVRISLQLRT